MALDGNLEHKIAADAGVYIAFLIGSDNVAARGQGAERFESDGGAGLLSADGHRRDFDRGGLA